ncbi:MAG TPA: helix-turn-helix domain-containing protein [Steroidobacteraceae bacterium]|nr:helix-turn-helix domain-containing protein [Steroidobacteraceae bacterium]
MRSRAAQQRIPSYFLYGEAAHAHDERTLHVESIEARSSRHRWKIEPHRHRSLHQLVLVLKGRGIALAESSVAHFTPPALCIVPAGTVHGFEFEPGTLGSVVTLADELLQEFTRREPALAALFKDPATLELQPGAAPTAELLRMSRLLAREHAQLAASRGLALEGCLALLLAQVLRISSAVERATDTPLGRHRQLVARFRTAIEAQFRGNRSIPEYARGLQVSESSLRNACLKATGQPPIHLVHARVLLEAKRQLYYTARPVSDIAYELGFDDAAYFTRFFTRRAGVSPRAFRARDLSR